MPNGCIGNRADAVLMSQRVQEQLFHRKISDIVSYQRQFVLDCHGSNEYTGQAQRNASFGVNTLEGHGQFSDGEG